MKTGKLKIMIAGALLALSAWALTGCLGSSDGSLAVSADDSASFVIKFNTKPYEGSDSIDVANIRDKLHESGDISDTSIMITDLKVNFQLDDTTLAFLVANAGKPFVLKVFYNDTAHLALSTNPTTALQIDTAKVLFELNKNISGVAAGFSSLTSALRDTTVSSFKVIARLEPVPSTGTFVPGRIKASVVLTASAKTKI